MSFEGESVYNFAAQEPAAASGEKKGKKKLYKSIHPKVLPEEMKGTFNIKKTSMAGTMGPAKVNVDAPAEFLKTGTGKPVLSDAKPFKYNDPVSRRPAVPKKDDRPIYGLKTSKNFVAANAIENILSQPKMPAKPVEKFDDWTKKPSYGKVPTYLNRVKAEVETEYQTIKKIVDEANPAAPSAEVEMPEEERVALLEALRQRWKEVDGQFQLTSFVLDTESSKRKYEALTHELQQLEKDIERLEKGKVIVRV